MTQRPIVEVHFKDLPMEAELRERIEERLGRRCDELVREFPEITRCEIHVAADALGFAAQAHVTGKGIDAATHAGAGEIGPAADQALDRVERQLRKAHDKRIFAQRREAQRDPPKRHGS